MRKIGCIARRAHFGRGRRISNLEAARIDAAGFTLLQDWPDGFTRLVAEFRGDRGSTSFRVLQSWLLTAGQDFALFRTHFLETVPGRLHRSPSRGLLSGVEAARALGVGHGPFDQLRNSGIITSAELSTGKFAGFFLKADIDELLASLSRVAPTTIQSAGAVPITSAKRFARVGVRDLIGAIQSGHLKVVGVAKKGIGLNRILVSAEQMDAIVPGYLSWKEVQRRLQLAPGTSLGDAVKFGVLQAPKLVGVAHYFEESEVLAFAERYISVRALVARLETAIEPRSLINILKRGGIKPICRLNRGGCLFLRREAEALLSQLAFKLQPSN